jgi:HD-GYP domain-containing protein (c-di-GMP phosphodiesterase class II)
LPPGIERKADHGTDGGGDADSAGDSVLLGRRKGTAADGADGEARICWTLVSALALREQLLAHHSLATAVFARDLTAALGLQASEQERAFRAGLVHEVGAFAEEMPDSLTLMRPGGQADARRAVAGGWLVAQAGCDELAAAVRHQAEQLDGGGGPDGLSGAQIPLLARVLAVASCYDELIEDRPAGDGMPSRVARLRVAMQAETRFDPAVVAAFEKLLATADDDYRHARSNVFVFHEVTVADDALTFGQPVS